MHSVKSTNQKLVNGDFMSLFNSTHLPFWSSLSTPNYCSRHSHLIAAALSRPEHTSSAYQT